MNKYYLLKAKGKRQKAKGEDKAKVKRQKAKFMYFYISLVEKSAPKDEKAEAQSISLYFALPPILNQGKGHSVLVLPLRKYRK